MGIRTHRPELYPFRAPAAVEGTPEEFQGDGVPVKARDPGRVPGQGGRGREPEVAMAVLALETAALGRDGQEGG